jgi:mRNA-degrading endonuclease RelE of RelBE toxin-antitoxin system
VPFEIICSNSVYNQLKKLKRSTAKQIVKSIINLKNDPNEDISRIANSNCYKMRVGDFRVIFDLQDAKLRILTIKSAQRG